MLSAAEEQLVQLLRIPLWGMLVSICLFGITVVQAWTYFTTNPDRWPIRLLVTILVALEFVTVVLVFEQVQYYFLDNYGNAASILTTRPFQTVGTTIMVVISGMVQLFFASRVYLLCKRNILATAYVVITAVASSVFGLLMSIDSFENLAISDFSTTRMKIRVCLYAGLSVLCDVGVTAILSTTLWSSQTSIKRTDSVLHRLLIYVVTRGFLVSISQTVNLILYVVNPESMNWTAVYYCMSRLYVITMLSMLNLRSKLHQRLTVDVNVVSGSGTGYTTTSATYAGSPGGFKSAYRGAVVDMYGPHYPMESPTKEEPLGEVIEITAV